MNDVTHQHAFSHAPAALRIFRFAADTAPRVLELAHVSKFLRECAVEFGSADATLPGALRCAYAAKRYFKLREIVERNAARCPWLAEKLLACRNGAPMPAVALAPDVTRHDVNWDADGARRDGKLRPSHGGFGLVCSATTNNQRRWAQGPVGVTRGKHYFQVIVIGRASWTSVGWVDDKIRVAEDDSVGKQGTNATGAVFLTTGIINFGTAPLDSSSFVAAPSHERQCAIGCLLDMDATPARMTVFVDGFPLAVQCEYDFPKDGRAWFPSVSILYFDSALHSCAM
jgi:hypothetical protein